MNEPLFEYEHEFQKSNVADGAVQYDLALRITKVNSTVPVSFVMSDKWLPYGEDVRFCEAFFDNGQPALEVGTIMEGIPFTRSRPLLLPGASVFLRDIPATWIENQEVVAELVKLIRSCCKLDEGAKSREDLAEAIHAVLDLVDTAERLLKRNRDRHIVAFPNTAALAFLEAARDYDVSVLSIEKFGDGEAAEHHVKTIVLATPENAELLRAHIANSVGPPTPGD